MEKPALLRAVKIKGGQERSNATDHGNCREGPLAPDEQIHHDQQKDCAGKNHLRIKEAQAVEVLEIHG
jgi:hypothetical protein